MILTLNSQTNLNNSTIYWFIFSLCIWLISHPFLGIEHDGNFYLGQALHYLYPQNYAADLFFQYGSQSQYTIFPALYGELIRLVDIQMALWIMYGLATTLWLYSIWTLATTLNFVPIERALLILLVAFSLFFYDNFRALRIAENFVTARVYAEALSLLALAFSLRKQWWLCIVCCVASMLLHPAVAIWGVAFVVAYCLGVRYSLWAVLIGGVLSLAVVLLLLDQGWLLELSTLREQKILSRSPWLFMETWGFDHYAKILFLFLLCALGYQYGHPLYRQLVLTSSLIVIAAIVFMTVVIYIYKIELFLGIQMWRVFWLYSIIAFIATLYLCVQSLSSKTGFAPILLLAAAWYEVGIASVLLLAIYCLLTSQILRQHSQLLQHHNKSVWLFMGVFAGVFLLSNMVTIVSLDTIFADYYRLLLLLFLGFIALGYQQIKPIYLYVPLLVGLILAFVFIDMRSDKRKVFESNLSIHYDAYEQLGIEDDAVIYLQEHNFSLFTLQQAWFLLRRSSYFNWHQLAGEIFNQQTSLAAYKRVNTLNQIGIYPWGRFYSANNQVSTEFQLDFMPLTAEHIKPLCSLKIDYLLLLEGFKPFQFKPVELDGSYAKTYYLYSCDQFNGTS